jgi:hypothetical protein
MKPLVVGEANPYGGDPYFALYPKPENSAGWRLCHLVLGFEYAKTYLDLFDRVNLCPRDWSMKVARERAVQLRSVPAFQAVLLGRKVAAAFRLEDVPPFTVWRPSEVSRAWCVVLPHPSGLCMEWNKPGAFERARVLVQSVYPYDLL